MAGKYFHNESCALCTSGFFNIIVAGFFLDMASDANLLLWIPCFCEEQTSKHPG